MTNVPSFYLLNHSPSLPTILYSRLKDEIPFVLVYLVQLIQTTNTNPEFLQPNFCLPFEFFYKVKLSIEKKMYHEMHCNTFLKLKQ